jgi:hypothetical protein
MEEAGISTVYLGSCRDIMAQVKAPRSAFLDFPLGHTCGRAKDAELQRRILKDALMLLSTARTPGTLVRLDYDWGEPFDWNTYLRDVQAMLDEEGQKKQDWKPA